MFELTHSAYSNVLPWKDMKEVTQAEGAGARTTISNSNRHRIHNDINAAYASLVNLL